MKGQGIFRGLMKAITGRTGKEAKHYPDPVFPARSSGRAKIVGKPNPKPKMKCVPGNILYHDWLVRELGYDRRLADGYQFAFLSGYKIRMPMPGDLR